MIAGLHLEFEREANGLTPSKEPDRFCGVGPLGGFGDNAVCGTKR
jgi:hypothetical protein